MSSLPSSPSARSPPVRAPSSPLRTGPFLVEGELNAVPNDSLNHPLFSPKSQLSSDQNGDSVSFNLNFNTEPGGPLNVLLSQRSNTNTNLSNNTVNSVSSGTATYVKESDLPKSNNLNQNSLDTATNTNTNIAMIGNLNLDSLLKSSQQLMSEITSEKTGEARPTSEAKYDVRSAVGVTSFETGEKIERPGFLVVPKSE